MKNRNIADIDAQVSDPSGKTRMIRSHYFKRIMRWWHSLGITRPIQGFGAARLNEDPMGWRQLLMPVAVTSLRKKLSRRG